MDVDWELLKRDLCQPDLDPDFILRPYSHEAPTRNDLVNIKNFKNDIS